MPAPKEPERGNAAGGQRSCALAHANWQKQRASTQASEQSSASAKFLLLSAKLYKMTIKNSVRRNFERGGSSSAYGPKRSRNARIDQLLGVSVAHRDPPSHGARLLFLSLETACIGG